MKKVFDALTIKNLEPADKLYVCMADREPGFGIRVYPSGSKAFFYQYKVDGQRRFMTIGDYPVTSLKTAREAFQAEAAKVKALRRGSKDGIDPVMENKRERERRIAEMAEHRKAHTVADLVKEYIEKHAFKFKRSWKEDKRLLDVEIVPVWGKRKVTEISKRDITLLLERIVDRGTPAMSNQVLKITRKMFNFAVERDIAQHTPFTGVKALAPNTRRERTLTASEIRILWKNLDKAAMSDEIRRAMKLVLVTAQRPGEITGMHTCEIDGQWWTIPAARSKNKKEHWVFLTPTALELIGDLNITDVETGECSPKGYIFPCPHKNKIKAIDSHALPVAVRRNLAWPLTDKKGKPIMGADKRPTTVNRLEVDQFTPHDLRRTAATFMSQLGTMDEVIDAVLNHTKQGIIRTYNMNRYDREKQVTLEAWERKFLSIINEADSNVIPFRRAAKSSDTDK